MKKIILGLATGVLAATAIPTAASAQWQNINARQDRLYGRIEQGVRTGQLTRREATNLRGRFAQLARLEGAYRRSGNGLSGRERIDLDRRFDRLAASVRVQRQDGQVRRRG